MRAASIILVILLASIAQAQAASPQAILDTVMRTAIADRVVHGAAAGVVADGRPYMGAYGAIPPEHLDGPNAAIFEIGSITKTFTGEILALMVQDGAVKLDDLAQSYLPDGASMPEIKSRAITLVDLATQSSGMPRMPSNFWDGDKANPYRDYGADKMYAFLKECKLERMPGVQYEYSNLGVALLGHALSRKAGKPYDAILRERILDPLGMHDTLIVLNDAQRARFVQGHYVKEDKDKKGFRFFAKQGPWDFDVFAPAGAIRSTLPDMLRYLEAAMGKAEGPLKAAFELAQTPHYKPAGKLQMGLCWHLTRRDDLNDTLIWHNGQTGGYHAFLGYLKDKKIGIVILSDTSENDLDKSASAILGELVKH